MLENRRILLIIPICIAIAVYPVPFDGKQVISIDGPVTITFDVLVNNVWKFYPFVINVNELQKINSTCSYYEIRNRVPLIASLKITMPSKYYVEMNVDKENFCLDSFVHTPFYIMHAYHRYCMHVNTLKQQTTIVTDYFYGKSWMIFKHYIQSTMLMSHKHTLDKLRKEMMIYANV